MIIIQQSQTVMEPFGVVGGCFWTFNTSNNTQGEAHCWGINGVTVGNSVVTENQAKAKAQADVKNFKPKQVKNILNVTKGVIRK